MVEVVRKEGDIASLTNVGDMTIYVAADLKTALLEAIGSSVNVEVDASSVSEIDSSGFQLLQAIQNECEKRGGEFAILNPSDSVTKLFKLFNATSLSSAVVGDSGEQKE